LTYKLRGGLAQPSISTILRTGQLLTPSMPVSSAALAAWVTCYAATTAAAADRESP
jgi:hypothetical protein